MKSTLEEDTYNDPWSYLVWARNGNIAGKKMCFVEAVSWVKNLHYAGYSDWRLPTLKELEVVAKLCRDEPSEWITPCTPYIEDEYDPSERAGDWPSEWLNTHGFYNVQGNGYWATTKSSSQNEGVVNMFDGDVYHDHTLSLYYLWPVREREEVL